jgi:hypothetical protein
MKEGIMTREEILNMPAGREMDALIAKKVMGWSADPEGYWLDRKNEYADTGWGLFKQDETKNHPACKEYNPSADIRAAWEIVVAMEEKDIWFELANVVPNSDPIVYEAKFIGGRDGAYACEDTAPLAICRAALLAVMPL